MNSRKYLSIVASAMIAFGAIGPLPASARQDAASSVLAERTELDAALAAPPADRVARLEKFLTDHPASLLADQAREALVRTHATIGEVGLKNGDPKAASEAFRQALEAAGPKISNRLFQQVIWQMPVVMAATGFRFDSIELMRSFEKRFEGEAERLIQIGFFYVSIESPNDAVRVLERAVELAPNDHRGYNSLGSAYIISLRLDDAASAFTKAIELNPKEEFAYSSLANLRRATGNPVEAIDLYKKQIEIKEEDPESYGGLAIAHLLNDDDTSGSNALAQSLALSPRNFRLYTQVAYYYASRGRYDKAKEMADLSLRIEPRFAWTHIVNGNILLGQKRYKEAIEAFTQAQNYGDFPTLHFETAKAYMVDDQFDQALDQLNATADITENGEFETSLGDVLTLKSSRLDLLLDRERQAVLFIPVQPTTATQYRLAEALARIGHYLELVPDPAAVPVAAPKPVEPAPVPEGDPPASDPSVVTPPSEGPEGGSIQPAGEDQASGETAPAADPVAQVPVAREKEVISTDPRFRPTDAGLVFRPRRAAPAVTVATTDKQPGTQPVDATQPPIDPTAPTTDPTTTTGQPDAPPSTDVAATDPQPPVTQPEPPPFDPNGRAIDLTIREPLIAAIDAFLSVDDGREPFRKIWIAKQLVEKGILLDMAEDLARQALEGAEAATELEQSVRDLPALDREQRKAVFTARAQDMLGWVMLKRRKTDEAVDVLSRSAEAGAEDPERAMRMWHLAVAKQESGRDQEALELFIKAYDPASPSALLRKSVIEDLYRKVHGSTEGLEQALNKSSQ